MHQNQLFKEMSRYDAGVAYVQDEGPGKIFNKSPSLKSLEYSAAGIPILASETIGHKEYQEKFTSALDPLKKYLEVTPEDSKVWELLGKIYANLGMSEESKEAFDKADLYR